MKTLRMILFAVAIALILIPIATVGITGNGWSALAAKGVISLSICALIGATLLGIDQQNKTKFYTKISISIGLLLVLLSQWL